MKLYQRFLASYLCVCLIPLAFSLIVVFNLQQEIQKSIGKDQETTLRNAQSNLESCLVDASNTLDLLSQNEVLENLALRETLTGEDLYKLKGLIQTLSVANERHPSYIRSFVYFPRSGYLVSSKSTYHPALAGMATWDLGIDYETLRDGLVGNGGVDVAVRTLYRQDESGGYLLVSKNWYDSRYQTVYASLGIVIQLEKEESFLNTSTTSMFALDADGSLFCGTQYGEEVARRLEETGQNQGKIRVSGETWLYSVYPAQSISNLRYGLLMLSSAYYRTLYPVLWQLAVELLVMIGVGIALAVFFSRRTWSPIERVLPFVEKSSGREEDYHSLKEFSQDLMDFVQEKERLLEQLVQSEERDHSLALWRYLLGFTQDSSCLSRYLEENQPYRLLAFCPAQPEALSQEGTEDMRAFLEELYKALEQVFLDRQDGVCLTIGASTVLVLVQNAVDMEEIRQKAEQTQQKTGQPLICYVSDVCSGLAEAPEAWDWVKRACDRDSFWEHTRKPGVWLAQEVLEYPGYFEDFALHRKQFVSALTTGKLEKAQRTLDTIWGQDMQNASLPVEIIRHRCGNVVEALLPYLEEEERPAAMKVISAPTVQEMKKELHAMLQKAQLREQQEQPEEKGSQLVAQVQEYIRKNYQDPFLNVSLIADRLNRNLSTLSHQYKDLTGHGLLEELHTVRLEAAKRLLKQGKTVRETAELTGYGDSRALIRAFKRYEGSTPGQFIDKK